MNSVISLIAIALFFIIVYGWAINFHNKFKYHKKLYMSYETNYGADSIYGGGESSKYGSKSSKYGGEKTPSELKCEEKPNPCGPNGKCVPEVTKVDGVEKLYYCKCNTGYSGYNCNFKDDESEGVRVNIEESTSIIFDKESMFKLGNNTWNNYL